jgi:hypothetical protein
MEALVLGLAGAFGVLRIAAARRERSGLVQYRQSGDVLSLRNNPFWRLLKGFSEWGLLLTVFFLQISLRSHF